MRGALSPESLLHLAARFAHLPGTLLLYSGGRCDAAQRSILALFPYDTIEVRNGALFRNGERRAEENPWEVWQAEMGERSASPDPEWIGFLGYELGGWADRERLLPLHTARTPDLYLQRSAITLVVDHRCGEGELIIHEERLMDRQKEVADWLRDPAHWNVPFTREEGAERPLTLKQPLQSRVAYAEKIAWVQEQILSGEVYQMCLSQEVWFSGERDGYSLFLDLAHRNPAPFSAFLNCGPFSIISSSPERLLSCRSGQLESRPIKGTIKRGRTAGEDAVRRHQLLASEKERSELMMIVDLMRNDLGRVSLPGSVEVEEVRRCEAYTNVFHTLSVITAEARPDLHPVEIVRACFPGGSITGCPKLRAMELIDQIEGRPRGPYCGAIGYFCGNGDFDLSVAIRILELFPTEIRCQIGGAIVADSSPEAEYEETLHKGETLFEVLGVER